MDANEPSLEALSSRISSLGFKEFPFNYQFEPRYFYPAASHVAILSKILDLFHQDFARMCVVGKKGTGKTTISMMLTALIEQEDKVEIRFYAPQEFPDYESTLKLLSNSFDLDWQGDVEQNLQRLKDTIVHQYNIGRPYFLIIEQHQPERFIHANSIMHELVNIYIRLDPAFHFVWLADELPPRQPWQVTRTCEQVEYLKNMPFREVANMIRHRCRVAGRKKPIFTSEALKKIFDLSQGNPGLALRMCDFALYEMASDSHTLCGTKEVEDACQWIYEFRWPENKQEGSDHASD